MKIDFIKCHGSGNDFILIDEIQNNFNFSEEDRKNLSITLCNREKAIGADGILFVLNSKDCDGKMRIFNSDGSEAEMCGNGLRCVGRYIMDFLKKDHICVETLKAKYNVKKVPSLFPGIYTVEIEINTVNFKASSLPMIADTLEFINKPIYKFSKNLKFTALSITNPHIVTFVDNFNLENIISIGQLANNSKELFPKGVNVNFVKVLDDLNIYVKTFERGVGITKSCGTGMTASTSTYCLNNPNLYNKLINIYNDGGMIKISVSKDNKKYSIRFIGNASHVYKSSINYPSDNYKDFNKSYFKDEIDSYNNFLDNCKNFTKIN
ncbi:diaminopimelate epimerase [Clostridium fallax]|uniref:Diaminopimelate epimerase n=1 Tax=Clostridium fallax TaxID=1533 RepID=A0A1M4U816_9CLOT|nr:diaminopimelate epimerase [Clostridium fallax]SHE53011.1 diaminopimelate epimerase [Clostridium fallax]SQB06132.1 diaminopimelate epimerase [Clostridium fallax]